MTKYLELLESLKTLETEKARISGEGNVLLDCWLSESKPGGTARSQKAHWQLRSRKAQFNGKKSKYIKASDVGLYQAAIARGKQLRQLDQQIEALRQRISKIEVAIAAI